MNILIDTHIFLWLLKSPKLLTTQQVETFKNPQNQFYLSSISIAEIMIKVSIGKLVVDFDPIQAATDSGLKLLPYQGIDAVSLVNLPFHHKDPFDRMLIAQAKTQNMQMMSSDTVFGLYGKVID
ncbi:type II toxin-antitoxin system VapC family toxin [Alkanindiges illinoisensis]|uniref:type II toxin-antitoxin system VapC family toxin n=1 Tax=Alkanindiges illinoisensis TaxID=197183 RepID=UPI00047B7755|nr:type II toxin-antitoxin system VapC family toxin [Alkanindiges illinoisensis]